VNQIAQLQEGRALNPLALGRAGSVDALLEAAREQFERLSPREAAEAMGSGALLIDIRSERQIAVDGVIPGSHPVPRNVLEWRLDPSSPHRDRALARRDRLVIILCNEGYQSSLAAATLCGFGLDATDVEGGFQAWRASGLPIAPPDGNPERPG
jgi:rhodanese-related sulfurtransferase